MQALYPFAIVLFLVHLRFVDTAGQERFDAIIPMLFQGAHAFVIVCDVTQRSTFDNLQRWLNHLNNHKEEKKSSDTIVMLLGNKIDLREKVVSSEEGQKFADEYKLSFFETSAKTGANIAESFEHLSKQLIDAKASNSTQSSDPNIIHVREEDHDQRENICSRLWHRCVI